MKVEKLKEIIKETVKEAIQEELKGILLEAVKTPKSANVVSSPIMKEVSIPTPTPTQPVMSLEEKRSLYEQAMGETMSSFNSSHAQTFVPSGGDTVNGNLGTGNVSMDQISNLLKGK